MGRPGKTLQTPLTDISKAGRERRTGPTPELVGSMAHSIHINTLYTQPGGFLCPLY